MKMQHIENIKNKIRENYSIKESRELEEYEDSLVESLIKGMISLKEFKNELEYYYQEEEEKYIREMEYYEDINR